MEKEELVELAKQARKLSYSPYSHFAVGAVVECKDGSTYQGANIENSSYPLCMCAERNAIYNAMMHGQTRDDFVAMALTADTDGPCSPCGACRQVLWEFCDEQFPVVLAGPGEEVTVHTLGALLPAAFQLERE